MKEGVSEVFGARSDLAMRYHDFLIDVGMPRGLIGPREADRLWSRHLLPCGVIGSVIQPEVSVLDVGSGAGLPGIPLALARPDLQITLLDTMLRRTVFLNEAISLLGLADQISVVRGRAEDHDGRYDVVVSRAVAPLGRLAIWCLPLVTTGGSMVAMKGESVLTEVATSAEVLAGRSVTVNEIPVPGSTPTTVLIVK